MSDDRKERVLKSGFGAVKESVERAKNQSFDAGYLNFFGWKAGDKKIIRFLTDEVITTDWYDFVVKKDGKAAGSFPVGTQVGWEEDYVQKYGGLVKEDSELVPAKAREKTVGIAVLREEIPVNKDGRVVQTVTDHFEEIEVEGKKYNSRFYGVVSQSYKNFWATVVGYYSRYNTICDRDYEITRVGSGTDTQYTIIPIDPIEGLRSGEEVAKAYGYGEKWNPEDPERFLKCPLTLPEWIKGQASEGRVKSLLGTSESTQQTQSPGLEQFSSSSALPDSEAELRAALINNR